MPYDECAQTIKYLDEVRPLPKKPWRPSMLSKRLYIAPKLVLLLELSILNNAGGSGDGDAALAHS